MTTPKPKADDHLSSRLESGVSQETNRPYDVSGGEFARIGVDIARVLEVEPLKLLDRLGGTVNREYGQSQAYLANNVIATKLVRAYDPEITNLSSNDIVKELSESSILITHRALKDFHTMFSGLARVHEMSDDQFATSFDQHFATSTEYLMSDIAHLARTTNLIDNQTGDETGFSDIAQRLRMLEVIMLASGVADDTDSLQLFYDKLQPAMINKTADSTHSIDNLANDYAEEIANSDSNSRKLRSLRQARPKLAQAVVNRAAIYLLLQDSRAKLRAIQKKHLSVDIGQQYLAAIKSIEGVDLTAVYAQYDAAMAPIYGHGTESKDQTIEQNVIHLTELDWEALPAGEVRDIAEAIVAGAEHGSTPPTIDLSRLQILANLRDSWGADKCYYARGKLGQRRVVRDGSNESPDQFLLLVMQELDDQGRVTAEHAVAESPIAGPHAMYIFRQDVSEDLSWREVMALPKDDARDLGARKLKHSLSHQPGSAGLIETMTTKVETLMACSPAEFKIAVFSGDRGIRLPRHLLPQVNHTDRT